MTDEINTVKIVATTEDPKAIDTKALLGSIVRNILVVGGTILLTKANLDPALASGIADQLTPVVVGALMAGGGIVWSIGRHFISKI